MTEGRLVSQGYAPRFFTSVLLVFVVWMSVHFAAMAYWFSTFSAMSLVTSMDIHTCDLRLGYDLMSVPVVVAILTLISVRERNGMAPRLIGSVLGVTLAVGQVYYEGCGLVHRILPVFSGQWWAQKNGVAYSSVILILVGCGALLSHRYRSASR